MESFDGLPERITSRIKVGEPNECWPWTGSVGVRTGYGRTSWHGSAVEVHRVVFEHVNGPVPDGLAIDHTCHTEECVGVCEHRRCENPGHLRAVTHGTNVLRGNSRPARNARKTHCDRGHAYTPENTKIETGGTRRCLECRRLQDKKRRPRGVARPSASRVKPFYPRPNA